MNRKAYYLSRDKCRCNDHKCESRTRCLRYLAKYPGGDVVQCASMREVHGEECQFFISIERAKR